MIFMQQQWQASSSRSISKHQDGEKGFFYMEWKTDEESGGADADDDDSASA